MNPSTTLATASLINSTSEESRSRTTDDALDPCDPREASSPSEMLLLQLLPALMMLALFSISFDAKKDSGSSFLYSATLFTSLRAPDRYKRGEGKGAKKLAEGLRFRSL